MAQSLRTENWARANGRCEYCQLPQEYTNLPHELDHIRARKHRGATALDNTCVACAACNLAKGPNVAGYDPFTDDLVPLFNPRRQKWSTHFKWAGPTLIGKTAIGRATIDVLAINQTERVQLRAMLIKARLFP